MKSRRPGMNNSFLRDSSHELALLYNDQSCLQNMSCAKRGSPAKT